MTHLVSSLLASLPAPRLSVTRYPRSLFSVMTLRSNRPTGPRSMGVPPPTSETPWLHHGPNFEPGGMMCHSIRHEAKPSPLVSSSTPLSAKLARVDPSIGGDVGVPQLDACT